MHVVSNRYLDPDPLLLAAAHGNGDEVIDVNPRFHALNQALVQLVSRVAT
jgi:GPN-loop GTPase